MNVGNKGRVKAVQGTAGGTLLYVSSVHSILGVGCKHSPPFQGLSVFHRVGRLPIVLGLPMVAARDDALWSCEWLRLQGQSISLRHVCFETTPSWQTW
jgi:hypothetical protein